MIERATFFLYNDTKIMPERNKYLEKGTLKDTWGKTNGTFSRMCDYYCVRFMRPIFITTDQKVQVGKDQEKAQSEKDSHSKNRGGKKKQTNNQVLIP